jgi:hypothetical protein
VDGEVPPPISSTPCWAGHWPGTATIFARLDFEIALAFLEDIPHAGEVGESLDGDRITAAGQVFRMAMFHPDPPDKDYRIANRVEVFDEPRAIAWKPGTESPKTGELSFGGWIWRYDLEATGPSGTTVTLTYDWSAVPPQVREYLQFPPFGQDHLDNSLQHRSDLVVGA